MSAVMKEDVEAAVAEPSGEQKALKIGEIIERMLEIRDSRAAISKQDKLLIEEWRVLEALLIARGDEQGMKRISSDTATATITEETLPVLEDMDALWQYMVENDAPHMLQRRVAAAAYRELTDAGVTVPGLRPYVQRKISLRKR